MKKKLIATLLTLSLVAVPFTPVLADEKDDRIKELETQVTEMQKTINDLTAELAKYTEGTSQDEYKIGDTWTVPGQWAVTINSVEATEDRNEFSEKSPAVVYIVTYTYENIGYEDKDGIMNGLYIDLENGIMDSDGKMGYSYPGDITMYPQETPVGGKCEAQACIGVDNAGSFKIHYTGYDGEGKEQSAVFNVEV